MSISPELFQPYNKQIAEALGLSELRNGSWRVQNTDGHSLVYFWQAAVMPTFRGMSILTVIHTQRLSDSDPVNSGKWKGAFALPNSKLQTLEEIAVASIPHDVLWAELNQVDFTENIVTSSRDGIGYHLATTTNDFSAEFNFSNPESAWLKRVERALLYQLQRIAMTSQSLAAHEYLAMWKEYVER
ncbi:hypothetical protein C5Y96_02195 [Blastopirellula marina]|uniref:Uncharacterized protein n=1 Tax=Blastopirellula marina TaxID=124 RepID=A0A2S8G2R6_9BACT|nr:MULTISPECIES: hypothetical protein [Pirellulaceae]PQO38713.1 hypothetical protein C5Y96_02195 [Blastopirellula marina]RCS55021.1 hypothetical protein DTL36_02200 [Bremerella cremea]